MKFGLSDKEYNLIEEIINAPLKKEGAILWCFGSRARGDHTKYSDLDLMVETDKNLELLLGSIQEKIEESNFPFKVDLVLLSKFSSEYLLNFEKEKVRF